MKKIFSAIIVLIVLSSFGVYAAGYSTGGNTNADTNNRNSADLVNCEDKNSRKERITCRLENKNALAESYELEEACRNHEKQALCERLYTNAGECYTLPDSEKRTCFIKKSGLAQGTDILSASEDMRRNYLVLLLYELQERIEDKHSQGEITTEEAAILIEQIVRAKRAILSKEPAGIIKPMVTDLKAMYISSAQ